MFTILFISITVYKMKNVGIQQGLFKSPESNSTLKLAMQ